MKSLRSPFALVLSGTPLENRLDDLFSSSSSSTTVGSVLRFGSSTVTASPTRRQDPGLQGSRSAAREPQTGAAAPDAKRGDEGSATAHDRNRADCATDEQLGIEQAQMQIVSAIVRKKYISEMDLLRLQKALLLARMNADSTYLVDKHAPGFSSKLERLEELFEELAAEEARKIVLFSEWTTMLTLIERRIKRFKLDYVRLDGSVPQKKRQQLVHQFQRDPACRLFLTTNAGSTGLNLQAANTVINVDLPWNPAVLEQRIARAHRMGQKNPVQVYLLVTEETIEEKLLATLSVKHDLALAALDMNPMCRRSRSHQVSTS